MSIALGIFVSDGKAHATPSKGDVPVVILVEPVSNSMRNGDIVGNAMEYAVADTNAEKATGRGGIGKLFL